ncbi:MAG: methyltransferase [Actinomycetaceae bacterium]|nr:methyltransferase [Actinomycetaceae bacterium]
MTDHYFSSSTAPTSDELIPVTMEVRGRTFDMVTADRVFSSHRLDTGTKALLTEIAAPTGGRILDLGCGWGPIAVSLASECPDCEIWAVDINKRALALTSKNAKRNNCPQIRVMEADIALETALKNGVTFDSIWSNPPVRIGKRALRQMLTAWLQLLSDDGTAWLVVARNLGADSLIKWLNIEGWQARKEHSKKGYRIISVRRTASSAT